VTKEGPDRGFEGLQALYINCTLTRSPGISHTQRLIERSSGIMERQGVVTRHVRAIDHDIAVGIWPDMREHGWETDAWPDLYEQVMASDILVLAGPIRLGDNSSVMKQVIERLYACSSLLNDRGSTPITARWAGA
jgi:multimeric flavodoxin WrbA